MQSMHIMPFLVRPSNRPGSQFNLSLQLRWDKRMPLKVPPYLWGRQPQMSQFFLHTLEGSIETFFDKKIFGFDLNLYLQSPFQLPKMGFSCPFSDKLALSLQHVVKVTTCCKPLGLLGEHKWTGASSSSCKQL